MMGIKGDIESLIRNNFPDFEEELVKEISSEGELVLFPTDDLIMDIGQKVDLIPLIVDGVVKVFREDEEDNEIFLYYLNPGEACAITLICSAREGYSKIKAIPMEDTTAVVVPISKLDAWMPKYHSWYLFVMDSYQDRFEELLKVVDAIAFRQMDQRLIEYLEKTAVASQSNLIKETQSQIALELNSSREVIGRLLKKLEQQGVVKVSRNQIELL
jgi:CRP/FNR family transcriptional regulator